jgi:LmbE family N-acetylglucosaminyl deacetylase
MGRGRQPGPHNCDTGCVAGLLFILPHPDDETFSAGTIAKYSAAGVDVGLICATAVSGAQRPISARSRNAARTGGGRARGGSNSGGPGCRNTAL